MAHKTNYLIQNASEEMLNFLGSIISLRNTNTIAYSKKRINIFFVGSVLHISLRDVNEPAYSEC